MVLVPEDNGEVSVELFIPFHSRLFLHPPSRKLCLNAHNYQCLLLTFVIYHIASKGGEQQQSTLITRYCSFLTSRSVKTLMSFLGLYPPRRPFLFSLPVEDPCGLPANNTTGSWERGWVVGTHFRQENMKRVVVGMEFRGE